MASPCYQLPEFPLICYHPAGLLEGSIMEPGSIFLGLGLVSAVFGIYNMIRIVNYLSSKGVKINFFLLRLKWFGYMSKYRELTLEETGDIGPFHRGYIVSMLISLVLVITGALLLDQ